MTLYSEYYEGEVTIEDDDLEMLVKCYLYVSDAYRFKPEINSVEELKASIVHSSTILDHVLYHVESFGLVGEFEYLIYIFKNL